MSHWLRTGISEFSQLLLAMYTATVNIRHFDGKVWQNMRFCEEMTVPVFLWLLISKKEGLKSLVTQVHFTVKWPSACSRFASVAAWKYVKCVQMQTLTCVAECVRKVAENAYYLLPAYLSVRPSAYVYNNWIPIARVFVKFTIADVNWNLSRIKKFG
jgi:hypothetical protein